LVTAKTKLNKKIRTIRSKRKYFANSSALDLRELKESMNEFY